jgi:cholesterol transport system auxiliary component
MIPTPYLRFLRFVRFLCTVAMAMALAACAIRPAPPSLYDLGPLPHAAAKTPAPALPALSVADVQAPAWLDEQHMFYRLDYVNALQPHAYAGSRWTMTPAALVTQRLRSRIAQAGGVVATPADGASLPVLRVELDDFSQVFPDAQHSLARVALRASLVRGRMLLAQRSVAREMPAPSADADGGAAAMSAATDAAIDEIIAWLASGGTTAQSAAQPAAQSSAK